jgi:hypothetical protein
MPETAKAVRVDHRERDMPDMPEVIIEVWEDRIFPIKVWLESPTTEQLATLRSVEGVISVEYQEGGSINILTDPEFDAFEIADRLKHLIPL